MPRHVAKTRLAEPPDFIPPELATLADKSPIGDTWIHEIKLDGYPIGARLAGRCMAMLTRKALDRTA